jgi:hypothetical protein
MRLSQTGMVLEDRTLAAFMVLVANTSKTLKKSPRVTLRGKKISKL